MRLAVEDFAGYEAVESFAELAESGSRILRLGTEQLPAKAMRYVGPAPRLKLDVDASAVELRVAKVARALCVRRGMVLDLDTGRVLPDVFRRPTHPTPRFLDVDLARNGIETPPADWASVALGTARSGALYADSWHTGHGHALLEGMARCWALAHLPVPPRTVVAHKAASRLYGAWFAGLGVDPSILRSPRRGPLLVQELYVPTSAFVLDVGVSPRFAELFRQVAASQPAWDGGERLYVSRRAAGKRRLRGEAAVEALAAAQGFTVLRPEETDFATQIRAFAGATHVAGPVGSGLYNIAFADADVRQLILAPDRFYTRNDRLLAGHRVRAPLYVFGQSVGSSRAEAMGADWEIDLQDVEAAFAAHLRD